jgi:alpha-L-fucosidase
MRIRTSYAAAVVALLVVLPVRAEEEKPQQATKAEASPWLKPDPAALKHWQEMRFGLFIHWGPVSLTGHEIGWSRGAQTPVEEYDSLYKQFNPVKFDADQWVSVAKAAGMKYVILTTKHHDGFCLWDTKQTDFNIMRSPFARDVTKELADACRKQGLAFGTYHSVCDWHHPDFPLTSPGGSVVRKKSDIAAYRRYLRSQVTEIIKNYGPLCTMWFDVPQEFDAAEGSENIRLCRSLQPDILVNNRAGGGLGDFDTPEQRVGGFSMESPWETCMTICRQWSWKPDDKMKTLPECLQTLIRTAAGDGNLLFNVGPMSTGEIEPRQVERLREMGDWLSKYGETIYATRGGPFKPAKHLASTRKDNTVYVHVFAWPEEVLKLPAIPARVVKASVLTGGEAQIEQTDSGIAISVAPGDRREIDTIIALQLDKPAIEIPPVSIPSLGGALTEGKKAAVSNIYQNLDAFDGAKALDGEAESRWATEASTEECWLEVDLGKPETFDHAALDECVDYGVRVASFELQSQDNGNWKTFFKGAAMGPHCEVKFDPQTAQRVRLLIHGKGGPTINEFQLFAPSAKKAAR